MIRLKWLIGLTLVAMSLSLLLFWLALNGINYFYLAMMGWPQNWVYVVLNVVLLCIFVVFMKIRSRLSRLPASIYLAFILALFVEMYGFTLTVYVVTWVFGFKNPGNLWYVLARLTGSNWNFVLSYILLPISNTFILIGMLLIIFGWRKIYKVRTGAESEFVKTGIYGYVRHPQYLGFLLITLGMNVLWVTITTLFLWPLLALLYYRLAQDEEKTMEETFGEEFREYKRSVPMFIPGVRKRK